MCKSNCIPEINEVFTGMRSVFSLSGIFTPESVYISKESFLSFNKLNLFPQVFFKNLGSQWRKNKSKLLGKNVQKTKKPGKR